MPSSLKLENIGCLVTKGDDGVKYSQNTSLLIEQDRIISIGSGTGDRIIDCKGKMVTPGFIDSHTHPIFYDLRSKEHQLRLLGATYEEIAESGGGIVSSVKSVREATEKQLYSKSLPRIDRFLSLGTTTFVIETIKAAEHFNIDLQKLYDVAKLGSGNSGALTRIADKAIKGNYKGYVFSVDNTYKDLNYINDLVSDLPNANKLSKMAKSFYKQASIKGFGNLLVSELIDKERY